MLAPQSRSGTSGPSSRSSSPDTREILAACLDSGELACRHRRSFARHRTITALEHASALRELRGASVESEVEQRPLARYDALIPA
jgi:hypothetical protein